jgi:transglutaminase-like putative cysteine protease
MTHPFDLKPVRRLAGYFLGLILAFSLAQSLAATHYLSIALPEILLVSAVMLLAVTVLFYNKITALITILALAGFAFWQFRYNMALEWWVYEAFPAAKAIAAFVRGLEPLDIGYHKALAYAFTLAAVLLSYITASKLRGAVFLFLSSTALFLAMWFLGHEYILVNFAACLMVSVTLWAYSFSARFDNDAAEEEQTGETGGAREEGAAEKIRPLRSRNAGALALFVLPFALFSALFSLGLTPGDASWAYSQRVESYLDDVVDYLGEYTSFTRPHPAFSIASAGFTDAGRLGGPVSLSGETVMVVRGVAPTLLRGAVYNEYTGEGWEDSESGGSYRYTSIIWQGKAKEVFDLELPDVRQTEQTDILYRNINLTITPYGNPGTIFTLARPASVTSGNRNFIPYFNDQGEMYTKNDMGHFSGYTVTGRQLNQAGERVISYMSQLEKLLRPEDSDKMAELKRLYLPGGDVNLVTAAGKTQAEKLAIDIAKGTNSESKYAWASAISGYLSDGFSYTLSPSFVPEGEDFVDYFLVTREGYCSYFASAMAVMARAVGIPSRYVEGYLLSGIKHDNYEYTVTGENAHAWAELYFEGVGWMPFDATPTEEVSSPGEGGAISEALPEIEEPSIEPDIELPVSDGAAKPEPIPVWMFAAVVISALLLLTALTIFIQGLFCRDKFLVNKYGKAGAVAVWWREILDMLVHKDKFFARRDGETAYMLANRIGKLVYCPVADFDQITRIVVRSYYSGNEPSDIELEVMMRYYFRLRRDIMYRLTPFGYIFMRILFPRAYGFRGRGRENEAAERKTAAL